MTWHDWMQRLPLFRDSRSRRRSCASYRGAGWRVESLEVRNLLTVNFQFDYSLDTTHFFDNNDFARASLEMAAGSLESFLGDSLDAIMPSGSNTWLAQFSSPGTGAATGISNLNVPANTLIIYVGGRDLSGEVAEGAPGGWSSGSSDQQWLDLLGSRGQTGALAPSVATDFGPWGGSLAFDSSGTNWFFGASDYGILPNQIDFMSAAQHELGHLLGFGTAESFDRYISGSTFAGPNAEGAYDGVGNPPLSGDRAHWLAGTTDGGQVVAMDPSLGPGVRRLFTGLDYAALNDIGWNSNNGTGVGGGGGDGGGGGITDPVIITTSSNLQTSESGGSVTFTAVLGAKPTSNVTFNLSSSNVDEAFLSASSIVFTPSNWNIPQTITVTGVDDLLVDGNKSYTIITSPVVSNDTRFSGFNPPDISITNLDNDKSGITVTPTTGLVTTEQGGTSSFVVYLDSQPSSNVTISLNSSDTREGTVALTTLVFTPTNWMVSQIVTVTGIDDHVADSNKTYSIVLNPALSADPAYAGINPPDVRVINTSIPDLTPTIVLSGSAVTVASEGNPMLLDSSAQVYDLDSPFLNLNGARLVIGLSSNGTSNDKLSVLDEGKASGKVGAPSNSSSITYGGVTIGTRSGGTGTTPLTITFNSKATMAMVQEVVRNLQFQTSTSNKSALDRSVTFQLRTSNGTTSNTASKVIHVTTGALPPVIDLGSSTLTYKNKSGAQLISPTASLTDPDSAVFTGGKLTVTMGPGAVVGDTLRIRRQGTGAGQIDAANDGTVKFGKTVIGSWSGGTNGRPLVITFKSTASRSAVQALIRDITFETSLTNTSLKTRTVNFQLTDGKGGSSTVVTKTINVVNTTGADVQRKTGGDPQDEADLTPTILLSGASVTVASGGIPVLLDTSVQVYDTNLPSLNLNGAKLVISLTSNGTSSDKLSVLNEGTGQGQVGAPTSGSITYGGLAIGTRSGGTGTTPLTITFNRKATLAMVQEVARNLQFQTSTANKSALDRSVSFQLKTADGTVSNAANTVIRVTTGALPPVINLGDSVLTYTNQSGAQLISASALLTDPDSTVFTGGKLTITLGSGAVAGDTLRIRRQGTGAGQIDAAIDGTVKFGSTVIGSWSGGTNGRPLVITLKSTASQAAVQALIRNVTFETSATNTSLQTRTVNFQVTDGTGGSSAVATKTIAVN